ncbi:hypothetical protein MAC_00675 [Metarhizium acridum CQMa 102]|uniref:Uncharacterized protein n=1 Tax=Metarhizium acridum (strain CQMa 102) TaxID=655827 RepID=E9DSS7_METAQ|nr:uncharacterized protein MAC_00675 [Metarhizium acridum CQMa 102]EFY93437.1 hypothetical protein MAC_00675 [Metarhizium acridum CQMa 102]
MARPMRSTRLNGSPNASFGQIDYRRSRKAMLSSSSRARDSGQAARHLAWAPTLMDDEHDVSRRATCATTTMAQGKISLVSIAPHPHHREETGLGRMRVPALGGGHGRSREA